MPDFNEGGLPDLQGRTMTPQQIDQLQDNTAAPDQPIHGQDEQIPQPRRATPAPTPAPVEDEGPAVLKHSTGDRNRDAIAKNFKRDNSDEYDGEDLTNALFGIGHTNKPRAEAPAPVEDAQDAIAQADTTGTKATTERIHGNTNMQMVVNGKPVTMAMRDIRQLLVDNGVDDLDQIPDKAVIASARTLLAARQQLDQAKSARREEPAQQAPEPAAAPVRREAPAAPPPAAPVVNDLIHEIQFGDADAAAQMLESLIEDRARKVAFASTQNNIRENQHAAMMRGVNEVTETYQRDPRFQAIASNKLVVATLQNEAQMAMTEALLDYYAPEELQRFDSIEARGTLYRELASQGLRLPSEKELTQKAYEATIQRLTPRTSSAEPTSQPSSTTPQPRSQSAPNVQLSPERQARARTVAPPPRVSSAQPQIAAARTATDVVMGMRKARGQIA